MPGIRGLDFFTIFESKKYLHRKKLRLDRGAQLKNSTSSISKLDQKAQAVSSTDNRLFGDDHLLELHRLLSVLIHLDLRLDEVVALHFGVRLTASLRLSQVAREVLQVGDLASEDQVVVSVEQEKLVPRCERERGG